ncbi:helix-turn-helix domain-containing protein [Nocardia sp. NPDC055321]
MIWIRPDQVGYLGPALRIDAHSTSVACLAVGLDAPFVFRARDTGAVTVRSAFAPARVVHAVEATEGRLLCLLIDAASTRTARCRARMRRTIGPFGFEHDREHDLIAAATDRTLDVDRVLHSAAGMAAGAIDARIAAAIELIRADPASEASATDTAAALDLSRAYFLRLFAEHTGTSFRRYRQWARILHVAEGISAGHDLTRCAADAGFSSPSHLSEIFHRMFGLSATALAGTGVHLDIEMSRGTVESVA